MATLVVVAHPDDEVLGFGGAAAGLSASGEVVRSCILSGRVDARGGRPDLAALRAHVAAAHAALGMAEAIIGDFPNIAFNAVPHLQLVQFIEEAIAVTGATTLVTHHPADLNNDHRHTALAALAAARLFQRGDRVAPLRRLLFMEVLSSTDWAFPGVAPAFSATHFYALGEVLLERKLAALRAYEGVMRPFPHPRSEEVVRGLAAYRGGQAGVAYAEAFQGAFHRLDGDVPR